MLFRKKLNQLILIICVDLDIAQSLADFLGQYKTKRLNYTVSEDFQS
jgi:hypothetical protein